MSCTFVMPPKRPYISEIKPMITEVAVAEIDNIVWFGRVTDTKTDFYNRLEVHCEGACAYLNDSVQPRETFYNLTPTEYLQKIIANHNAQVSSNCQITIAYTKSDTRKVTGEFRYESTSYSGVGLWIVGADILSVSATGTYWYNYPQNDNRVLAYTAPFNLPKIMANGLMKALANICG